MSSNPSLSTNPKYFTQPAVNLAAMPTARNLASTAPYSAVPEALKALPNWVGWKYETRGDKKTKPPYDVKTGQYAKNDDPTTWTTFEQACEAAADIFSDNDYEGIGFEFGGTSFAGIDFDGAVRDGVIDPYALAILNLLGNPYTETSPSGTGLHTFVECPALPEGGRKLSQGHTGIEIYHGSEGGRYFTCTGQHVLGAGVPKIDDISLPYLLITQNKDKKFKALWLGDASSFDGDESSADFALLVRLAKLTQNDPAKMEKFFSLSGLGLREKWTDREDYRQRSIKAAIETNKTGKSVRPDLEFHTPAVPDPDGEYVVAPADGQDDGWFPLGDISLFGGASGTGKTTFVFELLHKQKQGWPVLGHRTFKHTFHVLAYDRGRNAFVRTMRRLKLLSSDIPTTALPLAFGTDAVQNIINEIEKLSPTPHVIFLEGLDMLLDDTNKKSKVSPFMRQLQEVAAHFHIALIGSVGAPKTLTGEGYAAKRDKLSGSEAWGRNCETVAIIEFAENDDGTAPDRLLSVLPRNASAEKFTLRFDAGRLVPVEAASEQETAVFHDKQDLPIEWFRRQAELAHTDPSKKWFCSKTLELNLGVSQSTASRTLDKAWNKHYITKKPGPGKTRFYCWNDSPENPLPEEPVGQPTSSEVEVDVF